MKSAEKQILIFKRRYGTITKYVVVAKGKDFNYLPIECLSIKEVIEHVSYFSFRTGLEKLYISIKFDLLININLLIEKNEFNSVYVDFPFTNEEILDFYKLFDLHNKIKN